MIGVEGVSVFQMAMRRALAVRCMSVYWWRDKGKECVVGRKVDLFNATMARYYCDSRIRRDNGIAK